MKPIHAVFMLVIACACDGACGSSTPSVDTTELDKVLDEFQNRKIYRKLDAKIIASIPDDKLEQAVMDFVFEKVGDGDDLTVLRGLPEGFHTVYATWTLEAEVNNGGFNQFFWNSSGRHAAAAEQGFTRLGMPALAELTRRAIEISERLSAKTAGHKEKGTTEAFSESYKGNPLNELDEKFYATSKDLSAKRISYIRANTALFTAE